MREEMILKKTVIKTACVAVLLMVAIAMLLPSEVSAASKTPAQVKGVKVTSYLYDSLKVSWSKVSGATGYQVYQATSKSGKYSKIKTVKATAYTKSKLTTGKTYYYKVRAYKKVGSKNYFGKFSSMATGKVNTPGQIETLQLSPGNSSIAVSWAKVTGVKGYQLYRSKPADKAYTKIQTTTTTAYADTKVQKEIMYYYKVRAYVTNNGKNYFGAYSKSVSGKVSGTTNPTDPTTPTEPTNPTQPTTPTDPSKPTAPDPYAEVDMEQVNKDIEKVKQTGKVIDKQMVLSDGSIYYYLITSKNGARIKNTASIGYTYKWVENCGIFNGLEPGRFYGANYALKLKNAECIAYYTTDGSAPSPTNGIKVTKDAGRVKIQAVHTGNYGGGDDYLNLKIHFYVKEKLVALDYWEDSQCICIHGCQDGNGITEKSIKDEGYTLEEFINMQKERYPKDWYEFLPENGRLLVLKKQYPASWWEHLPKDVLTLYN